MGKTSQLVAPNLNTGGTGAPEDKATALEGLGKLKEEGSLLPLSSLPTLISVSALWEEKKGRYVLPTCTFDIGDVKEDISKITDILVDASSALSLLGSVDLYWKSQLMVDYSKDLHTCMMLDDQLHEEGYLVHERVIYHHGRVLLPRASKLKGRILQRAYKELCFSPTYSMKI